MPENARTLVLRAELPSPDVVAVKHANGAVTVFADTSLSDDQVETMVDDLDIEEGTGHALG